MNAWTIGTFVLLVGGLVPAAVVGCRRGPVDRLVGLELFGAVTIVTLMLMAQAAGQSSYLIVPLVLVVLSFAGTLVFTRLLGPNP